MDYDITIVCSANDFYLGDALCREAERQGKRCRFNWRDAKKPLKPGAAFVRKSPVFVLVFNQEALNNSDFKIITKMQTSMAEVDVVLLCQDMFMQVPNDWKHVTKLDAKYGLTSEILAYFRLSCNVDSRQGHLDQSSKTTNNPQIKSQSVSQQDNRLNEPVKTTKSQENVIDSVSDKKSEMLTQSGASDAESVNSSTTKSEVNKQNENRDNMEDWRSRHRREIAKLKTVMTAAPTEIEKKRAMSRKDLVGEAYLVPLYVLRFERVDREVQYSDLFKNLSEPSPTIMRALRYLFGDGVPQDKARAFKLVHRAVSEDPNDAEAYLYLGILYEYAEGTRLDYQKAKECYSRADNLGLTEAKARLGAVGYILGDDIEEIKMLLLTARKAGSIDASYTLGIIAEDNNELEDAFEYYSEAAESGHAKAQNAVATMYYNGIYVTEDINTALQWCKMSSDQGFNGARYNQVVDMINKIDKARPIWIEDESELGVIVSIFNSLKFHGFPNVLTYLATRYNIGILMRRCCIVMDDVSTWIDPARDYVPYVDEFYRHYKAEESRMKAKGAGISIVNGIGKLMYGSEWEDVRGGTFDKSTKKR